VKADAEPAEITSIAAPAATETAGNVPNLTIIRSLQITRALASNVGAGLRLPVRRRGGVREARAFPEFHIRVRKTSAPTSGIAGQSGRAGDRIAERPSHSADGRRDSVRRWGRSKP
jgi:hypothetical protein